MRRRLLVVWVIALAAIAAPQFAPAFRGAPQAQSPSGAIAVRGTVTHLGTAEGIPGVDVTLVPLSPTARPDPQRLREDAEAAGLSQVAVDRLVAQAEARRAQFQGNPTGSFATMTDPSGHFSFASVPAGIYTLTVVRDGYLYLQPRGRGATPPGAATPGAPADRFSAQITVVSGQPVPDQTIPLVRGATISGRIADAAGRPASNVSVSALRVAYQQGRPILQSAASKTSDDRGEFRLFYLPPGEYYVAAGQPPPPRGAAAVRGPNLSSGEVPVRTYYPREIDPALATPVRLGAGADFAGVNLSVRTAQVFTVRGLVTTTIPITPVTGPNGQVRGGQVNLGLSPRNSSLSEPNGSNIGVALDANATGSFQFGNLLPGDYYLIARLVQPANPQANAVAAALAAGNAEVFARMPIEVRDNVEGIRFVIPPPVELKGNVVMNGAGPSIPRPPNVRLQLISQTAYAAFPQYGRDETRSAADGSFVFPVVSQGEFILDVLVPAGGQRGGGDTYVADVLQGGVSVYNSGFTIDDRTPAPLQVVLGSGTGTIEGTVFGAGRKPASSVDVVLVPMRNRRVPSRFRTVASDASGHFAFPGLPPGEYEVYSWEAYLPTAAQDGAYLEKYKGKGQPVSVRSLSVSTADVTVIPWESDVR